MKRFRTVSVISLLPAILLGFTLGVTADVGRADSGDISPKQAIQQIAEGKVNLILDVRTQQEWNGPLGRIKGSYLVPVQSLKATLGHLTEYKDKTVLVYCHTGSRSSYSMKLMKSAGFKNVLNLSGGIVEWKKKGYATVKE